MDCTPGGTGQAKAGGLEPGGRHEGEVADDHGQGEFGQAHRQGDGDVHSQGPGEHPRAPASEPDEDGVKQLQTDGQVGAELHEGRHGGQEAEVERAEVAIAQEHAERGAVPPGRSLELRQAGRGVDQAEVKLDQPEPEVGRNRGHGGMVRAGEATPAEQEAVEREGLAGGSADGQVEGPGGHDVVEPEEHDGHPAVGGHHRRPRQNGGDPAAEPERERDQNDQHQPISRRDQAGRQPEPERPAGWRQRLTSGRGIDPGRRPQPVVQVDSQPEEAPEQEKPGRDPDQAQGRGVGG